MSALARELAKLASRYHGSEFVAVHLATLLQYRVLSFFGGPQPNTDIARVKPALTSFFQDLSLHDPRGQQFRLSAVLLPAQSDTLSDAEIAPLKSILKLSPLFQEGVVTEAMWLRLAVPWLACLKKQDRIWTHMKSPMRLSREDAGRIIRGVRTALPLPDATLPPGTPFVVSVAVVPFSAFGGDEVGNADATS